MTLAYSNTSTSQQGKYLTFEKTYIRQVEKFRLGLLPVLSSPSQPFHRERGIITFLSHDLCVIGLWSQGIRSELVLWLADDLASLDVQLASEM